MENMQTGFVEASTQVSVLTEHAIEEIFSFICLVHPGL
jgi:hypothetical protein